MTNPIYRYYQPSYAYAVERECDELRAEIKRLRAQAEIDNICIGILEKQQTEVERLEKRGMLLEQTLGDLLNHPIGCECIPCQVLHAEAG